MGDKKVKIREVDGGVDGAPPWITTFVDMISLLVTFFILLFTFSSIKKYDSFTFPENIFGTSGVFDNKGKLDMEAPEEDLMRAYDLMRGSRQRHSRPTDQLLNNLEEMGQKLTDEHIEFNARNVRDGLLMRFDERAAFAPGSTAVNPVLAQALGEFGRTMQYYEHTIVIEGYTDSAFRPTPRYPTAEALSFARAKAAADVMLRDSRLAPELVQLSGLGARRPRSVNGENALARRADRRVEVRILAMDRFRIEALEEKR